MEQLERSPACHQEDCPIRENGKCLEGLGAEFESCSHFYWSGAESDVSSYTLPSVDPKKDFLLFAGEELTMKELGIITNNYPSNLVVIMGESSSGKSTILTSIFDMFQIGGFKRHYFAGSLTQYGLERRCHHSRSHSNRPESETEHTTSIEFNFLHIAYKEISQLAAPAVHLLLSDISGERFQMASSTAATMKEMTLLTEADHLVYVIDGEKVVNVFERTGVITRAVMFIARAIDNGVLDLSTNLLILIAKADLLSDELLSSGKVEEIKRDFTARFESKLKSLEFVTIAARPKYDSQGFKFGHGLEDLLERWKIKAPMPDIELDLPSFVKRRCFDRYMYLYEH